MPDGTTKKRRYVFNYGRLKLFAIVVVLIYTLAALAGQQETLTKQIQRQEELTRDQAELEQRVEYYTSELEYIGTDEYVEQEARTRFGWLRPGEIKYMEGDAPSGSARPAASASAAVTSAPERSGASSEGASPSAAPSSSATARPAGADKTAEPSAASSPSSGTSASAEETASSGTAAPSAEAGEED